MFSQWLFGGGSGGSPSLVVLSPAAIGPPPVRLSTLKAGFQFSPYDAVLPVYDAAGAPLDLTGATLVMEFALATAPTTLVFNATIGGSPAGIEILGTSIRLTLDATLLATAVRYFWILREASTRAALAAGYWHVRPAPP